MKLKVALFGFLAAVAYATTAAAQGAPAPAPVINLGYGGLTAGTALGGEAGARVWRNLDVFLEGGSFDDVVTQRQLDLTVPLTTFLQQTQGKTASASVKMPAVYGAVGARWVFEDRVIAGWVRPYVQFSVGSARVKREPTFLLAGADVTASLAQYGVKLGEDLTRQEKGSAVTFGFGALVPYRFLYVDVGYRRTNIGIDDAIGINRFNFGIGARF